MIKPHELKNEDGLPVLSWEENEDGLPVLPQVKKKGLGLSGGSAKSFGGLNLGASKSTEKKISPKSIEEFNREFEETTGHKELDLGSDLPQIKRAREEKKYFQNQKTWETEIRPVLADIQSGTAQPEKLASLYSKPYGKKIVSEALINTSPELYQMGLDEEVVGNETKWGTIATEIQKLNRGKGIAAQAEHEMQLNDEIFNAVSDLKYGKQQVQISGRDEATIKKDLNSFGPMDFDNPKDLGDMLSKLETAQSLFDKEGNKIAGKEDLYDKVRQKLFFIKAQEPIPQDIETATSFILQSVKNVKSAGWKKRVDPSQIEQLEALDAEYIKSGLNFVRDAKPGMYKNVMRTIGAAQTIADTDYEELVSLGKELVNQKKFRAGEFVKEDNRDFSTYQTRRAEASGVISEKLKKMGIKNMGKVPDKFIVSAALETGYDPNSEEVEAIRQDEASGGYGIVKGGGLTAFFRGVAGPIKSIQQSFGLDPVTSYLNSKRFDYGDQKVPDASGNYSDVLPSERKINSFGNFFNKAVEGFGQFGTQVFLAKGIGKVIEAPYNAAAMFVPRAALTARQSSNIAAYAGGSISTAAQTYGHSYLDFLNKTGDPDKASLMALIDMVGTSAIEVGVLPDVKLAETMMGAFKSTKDRLAKGIISVIDKGGSKEATRPFINTFLKETAKIVGKEAWGEEVGQNTFNFITESLFSPQTAEKRKLLEENIDVGSEASVQMLLPAIFGGFGQAKNKAAQKFTKDALHQGAINFDQYKQALDVSLANGNTSQEDYDKAITILTNHKESIANAPKRDANNDVVSMERQLEYAFQDTIAKENQLLASRQTDNVRKEFYNEKVKAADEIKRKIFYGEQIKELPKEEKIEETPEQAIVRIAAEGKLGAGFDVLVNQDPDMAVEVLIDYAKQKYGVTDDGTDLDGGGREITNKEVDAAVTKAYPTKEALLAEIAPEQVTGHMKFGEETTTPEVTIEDKHSIESESQPPSIEEVSEDIQLENKKKIASGGENYITDLTNYTNTLYRETKFDDLGEFLPNDSGTSRDEYDFSDTKDLALGQGDNKGVVLEFDSSGIMGQVNTSKPNLSFLLEQGEAEYKSRYNEQGTIRKNLKSIEIKPDAKMSESKKIRYERKLNELVEQGWVKETLEDGTIKYSRPNEQSNEQPTTNQPIPQSPTTNTQSTVPPETPIPKNKEFHDKVDKAAEGIIKALSAKLPPGTKKSGVGIEEIVNAAAAIVKKSYDVGTDLKAAIDEAVKYVKDQFTKEGFGDIDEDSIRGHFESIAPPVEPPKPPKEEIKDDGKTKRNEKGVLTHLFKAKNIPEAAREGFEKEGLEYETKSQAEAHAVAKEIIAFSGIEQAIEMAEARKFDGDVNSLIFGEALNQLKEKEDAAKTDAEKIEIAKQFAEVGITFDKMARYAGRFNAAIDFFYKKSPLGIAMMENAKRADEFRTWSKGKDQSWKEFYNELMKEPEFADIAKAQVQEQLKKERQTFRAKRLEKVRGIFKKAKDKFKGGATYSTIIPPHIIETVLETMELAYEAGEAVAKIVQDAIDTISSKLGTGVPWDKEKFRKEWEEKLTDGSKGKAPLTDEEVKAKILDKFRKKLKGLSDKQKEDVVRKAFKKIVESGGLDYDEFRDIIAQVTGRGSLTDAEATKLKELVSKTNAMEDAAKKLREERTEKSFKDYRVAEIEAARASKDLNELLYNKADIVQRLTSIMQLSTLGIPALINNPIYNLWNQSVLRFPIGLFNTLVDLGIAGVARVAGKNYDREYNIFAGQIEFWKKLGFGAKEAMDQLGTGLNRMDYTQKEVYTQNIRPFKSMRDIAAHHMGRKTLTRRQYWDKLIQSTAGIPAEVVARMLNIGDKPQRFAAEGSQAAAFAKTLGLKGMDWKLFIEFPREEAYAAYKAQGLSDEAAGQQADYVKEAIIKEGQRSTFQQDNYLNNMISAAAGILGGKDSGTANLTKAIVVSPYIKIPSNAFWSFYNLINPEVAIMQAGIHAGRMRGYNRKGEVTKAKLQNREARYWMAHAVVGIAMRGVVIALVKAGVFVPSSDEDDSKKERDATSLFDRPGYVNIGNMKISNRWWGPMAMMGNAIAKQYKDMTPEQRQARAEFWDIALGGMEFEALAELENGIFANSSSILQSINTGDWSRYGTNTLNMITNIIQPATAAQINRAALDYVPTSKGDGFLDKLNKNFAQRSTLYRRIFNVQLDYKRDMWGEKIPKGGNTASRMFGISKANPQIYARIMYDDFLRTGDSGFLPPAVYGTLNGQSLNTKQEIRLQELVGRERKRLVDPYLAGMAEIPGYGTNYSNLKRPDGTPDDKARKFVLQSLYSDGRDAGVEKFYTDFPEFRPAKEDKNYTEEVKRDIFNQLKGIEKIRAGFR